MLAMSDVARMAALEAGFDAVGICDAVAAPHLPAYRSWLERGFGASMTYLADQAELKSDPAHLLPGVRSIVAVGLNYRQSPRRAPGAPKIAQYALGRDYHKVLRSKLKRVANAIETAHPGSSTRACVDSAPIFERDYAHLAGLGWFGKNTMLIDSRRGSWFFIGLLLTTVRFKPDEPSVGGCGTCRACIDACPTGAIVFEENRWQVDARRCISYLTIEHRGPISDELRPAIGGWTFGCDVCQEVCPFNQPRASQPDRAPASHTPDFAARRWPDLVELSQLTRESWDGLTRGSAVRRAGYEGLLRNARVNLDNLGA